jgi:hypothetical protein
LRHEVWTILHRAVDQRLYGHCEFLRQRRVPLAVNRYAWRRISSHRFSQRHARNFFIPVRGFFVERSL